jgi:two-component system sensor histidine kinase YesM
MTVKSWLRRYNTLRNKILFVYLLAMIIALAFVGVIMYTIVLELITDNAEEQMQQTAVEATGRMDSLYQQVNNLSIQVATNSNVQSTLIAEESGKESTFSERQSLMEKINKIQIYSSGIASIDLYTSDFNKLIPLDDVRLSSRIKHDWINRAQKANGSLVWIGRDSSYPYNFLAIKSVNLIERDFAIGGYLLLEVNPDYFQLKNSSDYMILVGRDDQVIASSNFNGNIEDIVNHRDTKISLNDHEYMVVKQQSDVTGWTLVMLMSFDELMEGVSVLRTATYISGVFGFLFFLILSYFISTMITRPIFKLTKTMKKRRKGELSFNVETSQTSEIKELNQTYNEMAEEINHLIQVVYEEELLRSRAELKALQSQINPHFLFNTLNGIYWYLEGKGDERLAELIITMSELFRYTIDHNSSGEWVTLKQELDHIEKFIKVMNFRFEHLTWTIDIDQQFEEVKIPKLLIQPLVENAIIHGVNKKHGEGSIKVVVEKVEKENKLICKVIDNGKGMDQQTVERLNEQLEENAFSQLNGNGIAIANVNKRLKLYYNHHKGLTISSEEGKGTCCTFEIPLHGGLNHA